MTARGKNFLSLFSFIAVFLILFCTNSHAASIKKDVARGNMLYNSKKYDEAIASFNKALEKSPDDAVANFNLGNAQYRKGDFVKAVESYNKALVNEESIRPKGDYNIGNSKYRIGKSKESRNPASAIRDYYSALEYYIRTMELDSKDTDAKFNYEFVERQIKKLAEREKKEEEKERGARQGGGEEEKREKSQEGQKAKGQESEKEDQKAQGTAEEGKKEKREERREEKKEEKAGPKGEREKEEGKGLEFYQKPEGSKEMTQAEAKMLLESYGQEEEPRKQIRMRRKVADYPEPDKDW